MANGDPRSQWEQRFQSLYIAGPGSSPVFPAARWWLRGGDAWLRDARRQGRRPRALSLTEAAAALWGLGSARSGHGICPLSGRGIRRREAAAELCSGYRERWVRGHSHKPRAPGL